mmetsp:Transcript_60188/g.196652  ORF Transcript_60188/g.196652 Transcript_60188/m.196652 type:complete len:99 (-) Transcript_60188:1262-1558(-)
MSRGTRCQNSPIGFLTSDSPDVGPILPHWLAIFGRGRAMSPRLNKCCAGQRSGVSGMTSTAFSRTGILQPMSSAWDLGGYLAASLAMVEEASPSPMNV